MLPCPWLSTPIRKYGDREAPAADVICEKDDFGSNLSANGASDSLSLDCLALRRSLEAGVRPAFPPSLVVQGKALACELPGKLGLLLSRLSIEEIRQHVISQGLVAQISGATLWRWLSGDALCPWKHRSWIFPRDPNFADKAGPILDLYERRW